MDEIVYETGKITGTIHGGTLRGGVSTVFGANGLSAYEIAVKEGFEGTVEEWLGSLKGGGITIDTELSDKSTNPVENRVVTKKFIEVETTVGNIDALLTTI